MAGMGSRLRPLTLTTPKPLLNIAGKTIVERLVENINSLTSEKITDIGFIIGNFPLNFDSLLSNIAYKLNAKPHIFIQKEPLGTAHAIYQAKSLLSSKVIIAYADTIFYSSKKLDENSESVILTKIVDNPSQYGVIKKSNDIITSFVEKPKTFVSNEAIIGIYYFKQAEKLLEQIEFIINHNLKDNNEFQLTRVLTNLIENKFIFKSYIIDTWLDTGNPQILLETHKHILNQSKSTELNASVHNSIINEPVYIGNNVKISDSIIGPYVSIGDNSVIRDSRINNSIVFNNTKITNSNLKNSLVGFSSVINNITNKLYAADYTYID